MHMEQVCKLWKIMELYIKIKTTSSSGILNTIFFIIVVIYCYLKRENYKVLKFYKSNFS